MLLPVTGDVESGGVQQGRLVTEEAEAVVAPLAQQGPNSSAVMVVVEVLR
nr:hypothetical protein [Blastococcus saxobsidens]